ncbi:hypothetical protein BGX28_004731 [Mortierella sp. GBA30]|nr:hypothetical protein BGX28_004731 [Mortierella sp. GBA30]
MKLLLSLSLASVLVSSAFAMSVQDFVQDSQVQNLAPTMLQEIKTQGIDAFEYPAGAPSVIPPLSVPVLDDIVQIISSQIFQGQDADWSRLEAAKLKATNQQGNDALDAFDDLTLMDTRQAAMMVNTIYDTVLTIPSISKEAYIAKTKEKNAKGGKKEKETTDPGANTENKEEPKKVDDTKDEKNKDEPKKDDDTKDEKNKDEPKKDDDIKDEKNKEEPKRVDKTKDEKKPSIMTSAIWDILGFGLIKSSDTVRKAKGIITPRAVCETTDAAYLEGVDDVVYYSSLTHGLAGGVLASAPEDSTVKSLNMQTIVTSIGKLAIELQMAQSVARLAGKTPSDPEVRTMACLALAADSPTSPWAQVARDINRLTQQGLREEIPDSVLQEFADQASLVLVTRGSGQAKGSPIFANIPIVRNILAFSSEVLSSNNVGDVLKYVFCPETSHATESPTADAVVDEIKQGAEDVAQKVLRVPEDAANTLKDIKDAVDEAGAGFQDKGTEGTDKAAKNAAGDKTAEDVKKGAGETVEQAKKAADKAAGKAEDAKEEL